MRLSNRLKITSVAALNNTKWNLAQKPVRRDVPIFKDLAPLVAQEDCSRRRNDPVWCALTGDIWGQTQKLRIGSWEEAYIVTVKQHHSIMSLV